MNRILSLLVASTLLASSPALADDTKHLGPDHNQIDGVRFDLHASMNWYSVFGGGGRVEFAIVPNGFLGDGIHDELALSIGGDVFFAPVPFGGYAYDGAGFATPVIAAQWNFYFGEHWSAFPEVGIALHVGFDDEGWRDKNGYQYGWVYPDIDAGIGVRYHVSHRVALLFRLSTPAGLQFGVNL